MQPPVPRFWILLKFSVLSDVYKAPVSFGTPNFVSFACNFYDQDILELNEQIEFEEIILKKKIKCLQNIHVRIEVIIWELTGEKRVSYIQLVGGDYNF